MIRYKSLRLFGSTALAMALLFFCSLCFASGVGAQTAAPASTGSTLSSTAASTFLVAPSFPLGYAPSSVATGDLRRSGKLDLVIADYTSGKITVFLGTGQGSFARGVAYDAGPHPSAVVVADIDGSGKPGVIVSNETDGTISVLLGNGDGTLQPRQSYAVGFNPSFIATGDFSGNGNVDVAVAGKSGLAIFLNGGNGNLTKPFLYSLSKTPMAITAADFNNDGLADVALANADGTVSILLGNGAGSFHSLPDISFAAGSLSSIVSRDLNKDGKIDLVITQPAQKLVSVLKGNGDGTFAPPASYPVGNEPVFTLVAGVNGDGVADLIVINKGSSTFSVLGGNGDGSFKNSTDYIAGNTPVAAVAGDFYGNGHVDLAIIDYASQSVSLPLGVGDGTFKTARSYSAGQQPISIASGDLNGDKIPGLVVANYCGSDPSCGQAGTVAVFLADDTGVYRLSSTYTVGAGPVSVALAEVNGTGNLDILALNRLDKTVSILPGVGDGTFGQQFTLPLTGAPIAIAAGDFNKDGKIDLAVLEDCGSAKCSQAGSVEVLLGGGDGSFQSAASYPVGYSPVSVAVGAITGEKNLDLVVANRCGNDASCQSSSTATVLLGDGTGKFTPGTEIALGNSPSSIALGNLTGSGLDLVVSQSTDNTVAVLQGNGDGTFRAAVPYPVGNHPGALVVADFNGDGKADVAVANVNDSTVSILYGRGDGTLQVGSALAVGSGPASLTAVGRTNSRHASLATANGNIGSSTPGTELTVLPNLQSDPPLASFVLVPSPALSSVNQGVLLAATLTGISPNPAPTGTVTFDSGDTALPDCTGVSVTQGISPSLISTATCTTHMLTAGSDSLTAVYSGDPIYDVGVGEVSPAVTQTVVALAATLGVSSPGASSVNGSVTFTAQLSGVALTPVVPSGKVAFTANGTTITGCGAVAVNATGKATCATSSLTAPSDAIAATYSGDPNFTVAAPATMTQTVNALAATMTLTPFPGVSVTVGASVTFTAQLTGVALTPVTPSGTVTYTINGSPSSDCPAVKVSSTGAATCTTASLISPADVIDATYSDDVNFTFTGTATVTESVGKTAALTTLTSSPTPSDVNQLVTFTATVKAPSGTVVPTGSVTFTLGPTTLCSATGISSTTGIATCNYAFSSMTPGTTITATYGGDQNFLGGTPATVTQVVAAASTATSVVSSPNPSASNQQVAFTATVTPAYTAGTAKPAGTVTFTNTSTTPATTLCTETIANGTVPVCSYTFTSSGSNSVMATYTTSDFNFSSSTSAVDVQTVNGEAQTITFANPGTQTVGTPLTLTATASSGLAVTYTSTTTSVCTVSGTTATFLAAGTCTIDANQPGNSTYAAAPMVPQSFTVNAALIAQTITFSTIPTQTVGTPLTLTATASSGLAVTYTSTTTSVCTVSGTTATFLAAGTCSIDANQSGNSTYAAAPMVPQSFTVNAALIAQTITFGTIPTQTVGTPLTLTATASSGLAVTYTSTTTSVCTVSSTTATFLAAGTCTIDANQPGNSTYAAAPMVPQSFTVNAATSMPRFTVGGTAVSVSPGATTSNTSTITVTPSGGFTGNVALTAAITSSPVGAQNLPSLSFGSTSPVGITDTAAKTATLSIFTTAATTAALAHPAQGLRWYAGGTTLAFGLIFGIGMPSLGRRSRRRLGSLLFLLILAGGLVACAGGSKGGGGNPGTTPGTYTVTVTGTSGSTTATGTVTLTVQ